MKRIFLIIFISVFEVHSDGLSFSPSELRKILGINNLPDTEALTVIRNSIQGKRKYCEYTFGAENSEIGCTGECYISFTEKSGKVGNAYILAVEGRDKNEVILSERCCPAGPCYKSFIFKKDGDNLKVYKKVPGYIWYLTEKKGKEYAVVPDEYFSALRFFGELKKDGLHPVFSFPIASIAVPGKFISEKKKFRKKKISLCTDPSLASQEGYCIPKDVSPDKVQVLSSENGWSFISFPAAKKDILKAAESFPIKINKKNAPLLQGISPKYLKRKEFIKLLEKTYFFYGWVKDS